MPGNTHATAATRYVQAGDLRFAYRRFGRGAGFPLLMLNYFAANLDDWIMRAFFTSSEASRPTDHVSRRQPWRTIATRGSLSRARALVSARMSGGTSLVSPACVYRGMTVQPLLQLRGKQWNPQRPTAQCKPSVRASWN